MLSTVRRVSVAVFFGSIVGAIVFASVSVVGFGVGWCSTAGIMTGLQFGAIAGLALGPLIAMLGLGQWKSAVWGLIVVSITWLIYIGVLLTGRGATFASLHGALGWISRALIMMAASGGFGGAAIAWMMRRVDESGLLGIARPNGQRALR